MPASTDQVEMPGAALVPACVGVAALSIIGSIFAALYTKVTTSRSIRTALPTCDTCGASLRADAAASTASPPAFVTTRVRPSAGKRLALQMVAKTR
jgi:hypothetical protein